MKVQILTTINNFVGIPYAAVARLFHNMILFFRNFIFNTKYHTKKVITVPLHFCEVFHENGKRCLPLENCHTGKQFFLLRNYRITISRKAVSNSFEFLNNETLKKNGCLNWRDVLKLLWDTWKMLLFCISVQVLQILLSVYSCSNQTTFSYNIWNSMKIFYSENPLPPEAILYLCELQENFCSMWKLGWIITWIRQKIAFY